MLTVLSHLPRVIIVRGLVESMDIYKDANNPCNIVIYNSVELRTLIVKHVDFFNKVQ